MVSRQRCDAGCVAGAAMPRALWWHATEPAPAWPCVNCRMPAGHPTPSHPPNHTCTPCKHPRHPSNVPPSHARTHSHRPAPHTPPALPRASAPLASSAQTSWTSRTRSVAEASLWSTAASGAARRWPSKSGSTPTPQTSCCRTSGGRVTGRAEPPGPPTHPPTHPGPLGCMPFCALRVRVPGAAAGPVVPRAHITKRQPHHSPSCLLLPPPGGAPSPSCVLVRAASGLR